MNGVPPWRRPSSRTSWATADGRRSRRQAQRDRGAGGVAVGGAGAVGGQFDRSEAREPVFPVLQLPAGVGAGQLVALPGGVVGVLHGQLGPARAGTRLDRGTGLSQLAAQHRRGPAVRGDVVHGDQQQVRLVREAGEQRPPDRAGDQVETAADLGGEVGAELLAGAVEHGELDRAGRPGGLPGPAVPLGVRRPEDLVAIGEQAQCLGDGLRGRAGGQPDHGRGHPLGAAERHPFQEPEPLLAVGERQRPVPGDGRHGHPGGLLGAGQEGLGGDGRRQVELADRDVHAPVRAQPADEAGQQQR